MARNTDRSLRKLDRIELLEILVKQGEQLEATQEALQAAETRAAQQERIARLAEDAISRLAGVLEAAQLVQFQYSEKLHDLKTEMGLKTETTFNKDEFSVGGDVIATQKEDIADFNADDFIQNKLGISTDLSDDSEDFTELHLDGEFATLSSDTDITDEDVFDDNDEPTEISAKHAAASVTLSQDTEGGDNL